MAISPYLPKSQISTLHFLLRDPKTRARLPDRHARRRYRSRHPPSLMATRRGCCPTPRATSSCCTPATPCRPPVRRVGCSAPCSFFGRRRHTPSRQRREHHCDVASLHHHAAPVRPAGAARRPAAREREERATARPPGRFRRANRLRHVVAVDEHVTVVLAQRGGAASAATCSSSSSGTPLLQCLRRPRDTWRRYRYARSRARRRARAPVSLSRTRRPSIAMINPRGFVTKEPYSSAQEALAPLPRRAGRDRIISSSSPCPMSTRLASSPRRGHEERRRGHRQLRTKAVVAEPIFKIPTRHGDARRIYRPSSGTPKRRRFAPALRDGIRESRLVGMADSSRRAATVLTVAPPVCSGS